MGDRSKGELFNQRELMNIADIYRIYGKKQLKYNTFIGNVYNTVSAKRTVKLNSIANIASFLNISQSAITNFKNDGRDIWFKISQSYFFNLQGDRVTYLIDLENFCTSVGMDNMRIDTALVYTPNASLETGAFDQNAPSAIYQYKLIVAYGNIGSSVLDNDVFRSSRGGTTFIAGAAQSTINGGNPDGDITSLLTNSTNEVVYRTNTTPPPRVTGMSLVSVSPTSVTVDFTYPDIAPKIYRQLWVFVDGKLVLFSDFLDLKTVPNLTQVSKRIQVILMDEFGNISKMSNPVIASPNGAIDAAALYASTSAYYRMNETTGLMLDATANALNGVVSTGVTRTGSVYRFRAVGHKVTIANNALLSFRESGNNTDFTIGFTVKFNSFNSSNFNFLILKRDQLNATFNEWSLLYRADLKRYQFVIFSSTGTSIGLFFNYNQQLGVDTVVNVIHLNGVLYGFINGYLIAATDVPVGFEFATTNSSVVIGSFLVDPSGGQSYCDIKDAFIIKGNGWTAAQGSDYYNLGTPVDYV